MAIRNVGGAFEPRWVSSLLPNTSFTTEREAAKADNIEARKAAAQDKGHEILDSLSTKDMKSLILALNGRTAEAVGKADGAAIANQWFSEHPEFISHASAEGTSNGAKMAGWLQAQHRRQPYTKFDLDQAYEALSEAGELYLDESKMPKTKAEDPADMYVSPLDVMAEHNAYRSFR
jgi:hypothetical protein